MIAKLKSSVSFNSLSTILFLYKDSLTIESKTPSYQTGLLWVKKLGYYQLTLPKKKSKNWIVILDESIGIGQEKVLLILGIRRSEIDFKRPLKLQDLKPLLIKSKEKWTGEDIAKELKEIECQIGKILYAVTDAGSVLKNGLQKCGIKHVYDITHAIALALEKIYKENTEFKEYAYQMGQMRFKLCCSKFAHLIPPNQRSKSRFLNIDILSNWGSTVLKALENGSLEKAEKEQLAWVVGKKELILELHNIIEIIKKVSTELKTFGLSKSTKRKCISLLENCDEGNMKKFREYIEKYLENNITIIKKSGEKLLCCSDIIESAFGRYKNEISGNPMCGITNIVLIIAALTSDLSIETLKNAMESCRVKEIDEWSKKNLCASLLTKRRKAFEVKENEVNI